MQCGCTDKVGVVLDICDYILLLMCDYILLLICAANAYLVGIDPRVRPDPTYANDQHDTLFLYLSMPV